MLGFDSRCQCHSWWCYWKLAISKPLFMTYSTVRKSPEQNNFWRKILCSNRRNGMSWRKTLRVRIAIIKYYKIERRQLCRRSAGCFIYDGSHWTLEEWFSTLAIYDSPPGSLTTNGNTWASLGMGSGEFEVQPRSEPWSNKILLICFGLHNKNKAHSSIFRGVVVGGGMF